MFRELEGWYCANDICIYIGLNNVSRAIHTVPDDMICKKLFINSRGKKRQMTVLNIDGVKILLAKTRRVQKAIEVAIQLNICLDIVRIPIKEDKYLSSIVKAFSHIHSIREYVVDSYRIDLYLPENNIAIECDEYGHCDIDCEQELERERYIKNKIKCSFIRFNPDCKGFDIFEVINQIMRKINK